MIFRAFISIIGAPVFFQRGRLRLTLLMSESTLNLRDAVRNTANDIVIVDYEATCAAGTGLNAIREAVAERQSGLSKNAIAHSDLDTWVGQISALDNYPWPADQQAWQSRNNALIDLA